MKKMSLISRIFVYLFLGVILGLGCKSIGVLWPVRLAVTFSSIFGSFLSFVIPLIIIGFIVPGIATLGKKSSKGLLITTVIAYVSTIVAGLMAYLVGASILPNLIKQGTLAEEAAIEVAAYFTIEIPAIMGIMSA